MSSFIEKLATLCRSYPFEEKWLVAPTQDIGQQWLEWATRKGGSILNLKATTLKELAHRTVATRMQEKELSLMTPAIEALLVMRILSENESLSSARMSSLKLEIRRARKWGLKDSSEYLTRYEELLELWGFLDERALFDLAAKELAKAQWSEEVLYFLPSTAVERVGSAEMAFIDALPDEQRISIEELRCPQIDDFEIEVFRCASRTDEVMTVFRRAMADGANLDDIEILYTEGEKYLPLLIETKEFFQERDDGVGPVPMTFAQGIGASFTRPGQALMSWVDWVRDDQSSFRLFGLIEHGLLNFPFQETHIMTYASLAAHLRAIPLVENKRDLVPLVNEIELATEKYIARLERTQEFGAELHKKELNVRHAKARQVAMLHLAEVLQRLMEATPKENDGIETYVECAMTFLSQCVRTVNEFDEEAVASLKIALQECLAFCSVDSDFLSLTALLNWLRELPKLISVGHSAAEAGKVHVAPFTLGGHTGRRKTYALGLDEESYQLGYSDDYWWLLLGRVQGNLTASYSMVKENSERELFPCSAYMKAFRQYAYSPDADYRTLMNEPPPLASSLPAIEKEALTPGEWLTYKLADCSLFDGWRGPFEEQITEKVKKKTVRGALSSKASAKILGHLFPHLGMGVQCHLARRSPLLTAYDGLVTPLEDVHYPFAEEGLVVTAKALETLARCPMRFYWEYILKVEPPFSPEHYVERWLSPQNFNGLLRDVFHRFTAETKASSEKVDFDTHWPKLEELLQSSIAGMKVLLPPPNADAYEKACDELEEAAQIFLLVEEGVSEKWKPIHLGIAIGTTAGVEGTIFDTEHPLKLQLDDEMSVRVRAHVDRLDRAQDVDEVTYSLTDYKTEAVLPYLIPSTYSFGHHIEHVLKLLLLQTRLSALDNEAKIMGYRWFFPRRRDCGRRLGFDDECLSDGVEILKNLLYVASAGAFIQTDDCHRHCKNCNWAFYCERKAKSVARRQSKIKNDENEDLLFLRSLRFGEREE